MPHQLSPLRPLPDNGARQALHDEVSAHNVTHKALQVEIQRRMAAEYTLWAESSRWTEYSVMYSQCQDMLQNAHLENSRLQEEAQTAKYELEAIKLEDKKITGLNLARAKDRQIRILKNKITEYEGRLKPINEDDRYPRDGCIGEAHVKAYDSVDPARLISTTLEAGALDRAKEIVLLKLEEHNGELMF